MRLLTKEIRNKLPGLKKTEGKPSAEVPIIVKFFNPMGQARWYIWEGEPQTDENGHEVDFLFFGLCDLGMGFPEIGYVSLNELKSLKLPFGLGIERDLHLGEMSKEKALKMHDLEALI